MLLKKWLVIFITNHGNEYYLQLCDSSSEPKYFLLVAVGRSID